jgi:hypothetical protein
MGLLHHGGTVEGQRVCSAGSSGREVGKDRISRRAGVADAELRRRRGVNVRLRGGAKARSVDDVSWHGLLSIANVCGGR